MAAERDSWDGWKLGWQHAFFCLLFTFAVTRAHTAWRDASAGELAAMLALLAALVGWYTWWSGPGRRRAGLLRYLVGAVGLWGALVVLDQAFWLAGFAVLVPLGMRRPAWLASAVASCGALWLTFKATDGSLPWPEAVATALTVGAGLAYLGYVAALDREGRRRARLLDELAATRAELAASERRAGTMAERQRLAREVHDTLTQGFASIAMLLDAAQETRKGGDTPADRHIATALRTARDNLAESRRLVWALRPTALAGASLPDAVRRQTDALAEEAGVAADTVVTGEPVPIDQHTDAGILRIVQETLSNIRRHARASTVTVTLSYLSDTVLIDVHDDGAGMPADVPATGMGLRIVRERAAELGGTLTVESQPGEGTTVALSVPVAAAAPVGDGR